MEFVLRTLWNFLFYKNVLLYLLALAGVWAVLWWSIDNFRSIVQITRSFLIPYFQPQENKSLVEKFGKWAGKEEEDLFRQKILTIKNFIKNQLKEKVKITQRFKNFCNFECARKLTGRL